MSLSSSTTSFTSTSTYDDDATSTTRASSFASMSTSPGGSINEKLDSASPTEVDVNPASLNIAALEAKLHEAQLTTVTHCIHIPAVTTVHNESDTNTETSNDVNLSVAVNEDEEEDDTTSETSDDEPFLVPEINKIDPWSSYDRYARYKIAASVPILKPELGLKPALSISISDIDQRKADYDDWWEADSDSSCSDVEWDLIDTAPRCRDFDFVRGTTFPLSLGGISHTATKTNDVPEDADPHPDSQSHESKQGPKNCSTGEEESASAYGSERLKIVEGLKGILRKGEEGHTTIAVRVQFAGVLIDETKPPRAATAARARPRYPTKSILRQRSYRGRAHGQRKVIPATLQPKQLSTIQRVANWFNGSSSTCDASDQHPIDISHLSGTQAGLLFDLCDVLSPFVKAGVRGIPRDAFRFLLMMLTAPSKHAIGHAHTHPYPDPPTSETSDVLATTTAHRAPIDDGRSPESEATGERNESQRRREARAKPSGLWRWFYPNSSSESKETSPLDYWQYATANSTPATCLEKSTYDEVQMELLMQGRRGGFSFGFASPSSIPSIV